MGLELDPAALLRIMQSLGPSAISHSHGYSSSSRVKRVLAHGCSSSQALLAASRVRAFSSTKPNAEIRDKDL